jgi:glutathione synthase/RimK-type ligase-like ATP-grasp enzyme
VHLIKDEKEFEDVFDILTVSGTRYGDFCTTSNFMVQEFIPETLGKDIRVVVLNGKCIGAMLRINPIGWSVKRIQWSPGTPETHADIIYSEFDIDPELSETCIRICDRLNLSFAGLDVLFGKDKYVYGEVNPFPGLSNFSKMNPTVDLPGQIIDTLINRK